MTARHGDRVYHRDTPTAGQLETLTLLFKGLTTQEVAAARHRAPCSIERAVQNLKDKAGGPRNIRELCYEGLQRGWLTPPKVDTHG